ncbi:MAG: entericidin A/B family lipoprotein [Phycisphaerales bacterium]
MQLTSVRRAFALIALAAVVVVIASCNTVEGVGRDIKSGGKAIENAASDAKN